MIELTKENGLYILKRYVEEVFEALLVLIAVKVITKQDFLPFKDVKRIVKLSFFIGTITLILEEINPSMKTNIKNGMTTYIGSNLMKKI